MVLKILSFDEFKETLYAKQNGLIVGNGFSINFDSHFRKLYDSLEAAHDILLKRKGFLVSSGAKPEIRYLIEHNYEAVLTYLEDHSYSPQDILKDGVEFARYLHTRPELVTSINESRHLNRLSYVPDMLEVSKHLYQIYDQHGLGSVNVEDWTVLLWLYFMVEEDEQLHQFAKENVFLRTLLIGKGGFTEKYKEQLAIRYRFNGLFIYLRNLFLTGIFGKGKAVDVKMLEKYDKIDFPYFRKLGMLFKQVYSLNYDHVINNVMKVPVIHLHGRYNRPENKFYFYTNNLFKYRKKDYDSHTVLLGNYTLAKVIEPRIHEKGMMNIYREGSLVNIKEEIMKGVLNKKINNFVFFGIHPDNDFHIFKAIFDAYVKKEAEQMTITFCYYAEDEKNALREALMKVNVSMGKEIMKSGLINIQLVRTEEVLNRYKELI